MRKFLTPNLSNTGRLLRAALAAVFLAGAWWSLRWSPFLALGLLLSALFVLFEALRGWCLLRACGIKTRY